MNIIHTRISIDFKFQLQTYDFEIGVKDINCI